MTWTYTESPGTSTADGRRDAVRVLIGDTDTNDQQLQDAEITFVLSENANNVYKAAAQAARMVAGKYARLVDTDFEGVSTDYSDRQKQYHSLAVKLESEAKRKGGTLGGAKAGGISIDTIDEVNEDSDRPMPAFRRRQFRNPPVTGRDDWRRD